MSPSSLWDDGPARIGSSNLWRMTSRPWPTGIRRNPTQSSRNCSHLKIDTRDSSETTQLQSQKNYANRSLTGILPQSAVLTWGCWGAQCNNACIDCLGWVTGFEPKTFYLGTFSA